MIAMLLVLSPLTGVIGGGFVGTVSAEELGSSDLDWEHNLHSDNVYDVEYVEQEGVVFSAGADGVRAYDYETGNEIWSDTSAGYRTVTYENGTVYAGDSSSTVYAFNPSDGTQQWSHQHSDAATSNQVWGVTEVDGIVYYITTESGANNVVAYNPSTGSEEWVTGVSGMPLGMAVDESNGTIYIGVTDSNRVSEVSMSDGAASTLYTVPSGYPGHVEYHNGVVYSSTYDGYATSYDVSAGEKKWELDKTSSTVELYGLAYSEARNALYTGTGSGEALVLDPADGSTIHSHSLHTDGVFGVEASGNGDIITGSFDTSVKAVSVPTSSYTFSGTVTNAQTDTTISGADVTLVDASSGEVVSTVTTASSGQYSFDVTEKGDYTVRVEAGGYESDEQTVTVDSATTHDVSLAVKAVSGSVTAGGSGVGDATVELQSDGTVIDSATTASDGSYTLQPDTAGTYTVSVSASGYDDDSATVDTTSQTTLNFGLNATTHAFSGTVIDARSSEAVENATVELQSDGTVIDSATTASDGQYDLGNHEEGSYTLRVEGDGYVGDTYDVTVAGPLDKPIALHPSNTWTYDLSGNGDSMWAVYEASGTVDVTVEAYDEDAGEWVVVHEQTYTTNGTSTEQDVLEINATEDGYTEYRVTMQGEVKPSAVGVTSVTPIFGVAETISEVSGLSSGIVVGALVTGIVWMVLRARE